MLHQDIQFYVSLKGVILLEKKVLLLCKPNGEWDLPGGRLGAGEKPNQCLIREIQEETGLTVKPGKILHRWIRRRSKKVDVFLVSQLCVITGSAPEPVTSREHEDYGWFSTDGIADIKTSKGVRKSVQRAFRSSK